MKNIYSTVILFLILTVQSGHSQNYHAVVGYFPSWAETWTTANQNSKLREVPNFVNHIFLAFGKPNLTYVAGSFDISTTGIQVPYDGCTLKESVAELKGRGIRVYLSIGGETYWSDPDAFNIHYDQIKALVDDIGFIGIDWDFEPNGSFSDIGTAANVQHYKDFINNSRAVMPRSGGYHIACAPSGVGALGGQTNDDPASPYRFSNRNTLTGESDSNLYNGTATTNGINLFGYSATGHMIPVLQSVGSKLDLLVFQGYNVGGSANRQIMYDSFAYYAEQFSFPVVAGVHYPNEPWGPYYNYDHANIASLASHIRNYPPRTDNYDGISIWQILLQDQSLNSSSYSYLNVASKVLTGTPVAIAVQNANNFDVSPYFGGGHQCDTSIDNDCGIYSYDPTISYPIIGTLVYHNCTIWRNSAAANPNQEPGEYPIWNYINPCAGTGICNLSVRENFKTKLQLGPNPATHFISVIGLDQSRDISIYNMMGALLLKTKISDGQKIDVHGLASGIYLVKFDNGKVLKFVKK